MVEAGAYPSPLNYFNFPKSVCTSVNEVRAATPSLRGVNVPGCTRATGHPCCHSWVACSPAVCLPATWIKARLPGVAVLLQVICHGIPDQRELLGGDIVNVDVTAFIGGYHGDLNETFTVGKVRSGRLAAALDQQRERRTQHAGQKFWCLLAALGVLGAKVRTSLRIKKIAPAGVMGNALSSPSTTSRNDAHGWHLFLPKHAQEPSLLSLPRCPLLPRPVRLTTRASS
jgi:hypothetical protein